MATDLRGEAVSGVGPVLRELLGLVRARQGLAHGSGPLTEVRRRRGQTRHRREGEGR